MSSSSSSSSELPPPAESAYGPPKKLEHIIHVGFNITFDEKSLQIFQSLFPAGWAIKSY